MHHEWTLYVEGDRQDDDLRNRIIAREIGNLAALAESVASSRRGGVDPDDLQQIGALQLIRCAEKYNPDSNITFWQYATQAVLGAMLESLRTDGESSRAQKEKAAARQRCIVELGHELGRSPTAEEICERLDWKLHDFLESMVAHKVYLGAANFDDADHASYLASRDDRPELLIDKEDEFRALTARLPLDQMTALHLTWTRRSSPAELAEVMGVSLRDAQRLVEAAREGVVRAMRRAD